MLSVRKNLPWRDRQQGAPAGATPKDLVDHARLFIKLDLAYVIAVGAGITTLQAGGDDLLGAAVTFRSIVAAYSLLLLLDTVLYTWLYSRWANIFTKHSLLPPVPDALLKPLLAVQPILHGLFVIFAIGGLHAYASGMAEAVRELEAQANVQTAVELHVASGGALPESVTQLKPDPLLQGAVPLLGGPQAIRIEPRPNNGYRITFAGDDGLFDTVDDRYVINGVSLREILNKANKR